MLEQTDIGSWVTISIHALREEGDYPHHRSASKAAYFYPRPPRGGRQQLKPSKTQSGLNFYPRPPRGGRLYYFYAPNRIL